MPSFFLLLLGEELCLNLCGAPGGSSKGLRVSGSIVFSVTPVARR